jgi:hypothetical protein
MSFTSSILSSVGAQTFRTMIWNHGPLNIMYDILSLIYFCTWMVFVPHRKHLWASTACYRDSFTVLHVDDVRTSQETQDSTACYGDTSTLLYIHDVRTSQETQDSTACYGDSFNFYFYSSVSVSRMVCNFTIIFHSLQANRRHVWCDSRWRYVGNLTCSREGTPSARRMRGWMGPTTVLDTVQYREISYPCKKYNPIHRTRSQSLYRLSQPVICRLI